MQNVYMIKFQYLNTKKPFKQISIYHIVSAGLRRDFFHIILRICFFHEEVVEYQIGGELAKNQEFAFKLGMN